MSPTNTNYSILAGGTLFGLIPVVPWATMLQTVLMAALGTCVSWGFTRLLNRWGRLKEK
ncbi:MAG: hypothetical protein LBE34_02155 [Flavobacteriaceae bacterium]|nr:hypothetical protein [Flavobacteriaceae bacterium]